MIDILPRINELSKKQREVGLSSTEKIEQKSLRESYIHAIRGQVLHTFSNLTVIDPIGKDVTPEKVRKLQLND